MAEKAKRLEASVERNAEKVRKQAAAKKAAAEKKGGGARRPAGAPNRPGGAGGRAKPAEKAATVHRRADKPAGGGKAHYGKKDVKVGVGKSSNFLLILSMHLRCRLKLLPRKFPFQKTLLFPS